MFNIKRLIKVFRRHLTQVTWLTLIILLLFHGAFTYFLLLITGEQSLVSEDNFLYYYIVTTSTVGYGDFSPATTPGKLVVAIFQIPLGLALFGAVLGKIGQSVTTILRRHMTGEKDFSTFDDHILIFGWHPNRTPKIIDHILGDKNRCDRSILLCVKEDINHPFSDNSEVEFAKLDSFTNGDELKRVSINQAARIIVDADDDNETLTVTLRISKLVNENCHISTHFEDEVKAQMLREHCNNVESSVSHSVEMLVRSIQDPGSSRVQEELLSTLKGDTQFSVQIPDNLNAIEFIKLFEQFKQKYNATVIGIADNRMGDGMILNPPSHSSIKAGQIIHYIATHRLHSHDIQWNQLYH